MNYLSQVNTTVQDTLVCRQRKALSSNTAWMTVHSVQCITALHCITLQGVVFSQLPPPHPAVKGELARSGPSFQLLWLSPDKFAAAKNAMMTITNIEANLTEVIWEE